ncbi:DUF1189 family protein [Mycoplasmatota bacterium]|nr:DUF1189 family protein [Mycoplasmatota bacterium]
MTEKLNKILFHPSTLNQFKHTHLLKVLLYLLILSLFSIIVPIIDRIKSPELTIADKSQVEILYGFNFDNAKDLPDCSLNNGTYTCEDEASETKEIGVVLNLFNIVSDVDDTMGHSNYYYTVKLTEKNIKIKDRFGTEVIINYKDTPSKWQSFDFKEIKASNNPSDSLFLLFIRGFNQILVKLTPIILAINITFSFIIKSLEILLYSLLFYLFYKRFQFKFIELFKITIFAHTLPVTIGVILDLLQFNVVNTFMIPTLTFIYVYIAIYSSLPKNKEF